MRFFRVFFLLAAASAALVEQSRAIEFKLLPDVTMPKAQIIPLDKSWQKEEVPGLGPVQPPPTLPPKIELPKKPEPREPACPEWQVC
jgi:hypothetical protein